MEGHSQRIWRNKESIHNCHVLAEYLQHPGMAMPPTCCGHSKVACISHASFRWGQNRMHTHIYSGIVILCNSTFIDTGMYANSWPWKMSNGNSISTLSTLSLTHSRTFQTGFVWNEMFYVWSCPCFLLFCFDVFFVIPHIVCVMMFFYSCPILCIHPKLSKG